MTANWNRQFFPGEDPEKHPAVETLRRDLPSAVLEIKHFGGEVWAVVSPSEAIEALTLLRDDPALNFDFLSDLTAVHWPKRKGTEFELVYQLYSISHRQRSGPYPAGRADYRLERPGDPGAGAPHPECGPTGGSRPGVRAAHVPLGAAG